MSFLDSNGSISNPYRNFIALSRYARWLETEQRRETWKETVQRYISFMKSHMLKNYNYDNEDIFNEIESAILEHKIMPSMRGLMTAGPALDRDNVAIYNCSTIAVDSPRAFDEAMYILMNGTGVGFSVEQKYVDCLPVVSEDFYPTDTVIVVEDSKLGWAKAYKELIALLYQGQMPKWDLTKLRPAGTRLKVFGGRASGPEPLDMLFRFTVKTFQNAAGRRLKPIECHDIMCKIGEIVVSGGVRRSALISLSDLSDFEMAKAKSGQWWEDNGQRALANNSAVYYSKPNVSQFLREWRNLYDSKSGERGIFNLDGVRRHVAKYGRRDASKIVSTNPCLTGDSLLMTEDGWISFEKAYIKANDNNIVVDGRVSYRASDDGIEHKQNWIFDKSVGHNAQTMKASKVFLTQKNSDIVKIDTTSGYSVRLTPDHLVMTQKGMVEAQHLKPKDKILITKGHLPEEELGMPKTLEEKEAVLMGLIAGDGTFTRGVSRSGSKENGRNIAHICLWNKDRDMADNICQWISDIQDNNELNIMSLNNQPFAKPFLYLVPLKNKIEVRSTFLALHLEKKYGFSPDSKHTVPNHFIEFAASRAARFYVAGLAFCDGTVNFYNKIGSSSARIAQSNKKMLCDVQLILLSNGIHSAVYSRKPAGFRLLPDGRGWKKEYPVKELFELVISANAYEFTKVVGYLDGYKQERAERTFTKSRKQNAYATVLSVTEDGNEDVYCLQENERRILCANGITMRRCSEILLRSNQFCNLTEVIIEENDTEESLKEKIRLATILGTWQSTLTNFKYIRKIWKDNSEEERLLGVSMTGIFGNKLTSTSGQNLADLLDRLREYSIEINKKESEILGIQQSTAITCVKPSGCRPWDALTTTSSGILTLQEVFFDSGHIEGNSWHSFNSPYHALQGPYKSAITKTFDNGKEEVFSIKMSYGMEVRSTANHRWFVKERYKSGAKRVPVNEWVETRNLVAGDIFDINLGIYDSTSEYVFKKLNSRALSMRSDANEIRQPEQMSPSIAWFLGYLWGDGAMSPGKYRIRFIDANVANLEKIQRIFFDEFGLESNIHKASQHRAAHTLDVGSKMLWHWCIKNGVWKYDTDGSIDLIPECVRRSSKESIIAFIAGLLDADGCVVNRIGKERTMTLATADEDFGRHIQDVSAAVGIVWGRSHNTAGKNLQKKKSMWLMTMEPDTTVDSFNLLEKHSEKMKYKSDLPWSPLVRNTSGTRIFGKVESVSSIGIKETFDIEVENTHWYYAGAIKSHNTVSQLALVSSGIHPWHAPYYIRTVRAINNDPITNFLKDIGIPNEPDFMKPNDTTVFSFPIKAPEGAVVTTDLTAIDHLNIWKTYRAHWTEHNPSVTINVRENEWVEVASWVYENFDDIGGVSFLPYSEHTYKQAPYQEITKEEYDEMVEKMPKHIDWSRLSEYEKEDGTKGVQELSCTSSTGCEIVDIS